MKTLFLIFSFLISNTAAESLHVQKNGGYFDMSVFEKKKEMANEQASNNSKIRCRYVCDKKLYREQKISEAIEFYKNSREYGFNKD